MKQPEMTLHSLPPNDRYANLRHKLSHSAASVEQTQCKSNRTTPAYLFHGNANNFKKRSQKLLYVEGTTDKALVQKLNHLQVEIVPVINFIKPLPTSPFYKSFNSFKINNVDNTSPEIQLINSTYPNTKPSHKDLVKTLVDKTNNYGLVDLDFDTPKLEYNSQRLLYTDTHDIETFILYSDNQILEALGIDDELKNKAYYMAYQLANVRFVLEDMKSNYRTFLKPDSLVFADLKNLFCEDTLKLSLNKLKAFFQAKVQQSDTQLDIFINNCRLIGFDTETSEWGESFSTFDYKKIEIFWYMVNGHDILSILCCLNPELAEKYHRTATTNNNPNREFEMDLINHYNINCMTNTDLYNGMVNLKLVA